MSDMRKNDRSPESESARLKREADEELDRELMDTFPASDALTITRGSQQYQHRRASKDPKA